MSSKRRDPHAHAIHAPAARLLAALPFRALSSRGRRPLSATLDVVSLIDVLVVIVLFLLVSAPPADGECCLKRRIAVPSAENVEDVIDAPMVSVAGRSILIDGVYAGSPRDVAEAGRTARIDEVFQQLRSKRELWRSVQPNKPFPGVCILMIDGWVPAVVVKSVFLSATQAGYPNISFLVHPLHAPPT